MLSRLVSRLSLILILSLLFSCGGKPIEVRNDTAKINRIRRNKEEANRRKNGSIVLTELKRGRETPFEDAIGRQDDSLLISSYKGKVFISDTLSRYKREVFNLKAEFMVDHIYVYRMKEKWFVVWQETDHEGVKSYAALFRTGVQKPDWKQVFLVPNPAAPVIDGSSAYISTLGMVGRIDIDNGKFIWKHDSLFNQMIGSYKIFFPAQLYEKKVLFIDYPVPGKHASDTLEFDPESGAHLK